MKKVLVTILLMLAFVNVDAKEAGLNVDKDKVLFGENVTLSLDKCDDKIKLEYDNNIFESITEDNFEGVKIVSKEKNTFYLDEASDLKINLKAKDDNTVGMTIIKVECGTKSFSKVIDIDVSASSHFWRIFTTIVICIVVIGLIGGLIYFISKKYDVSMPQLIISFVILALICFFSSYTQEIERNDVVYNIAVKDTDDSNTDNNENINDNNDDTQNEESDNKNTSKNKVDNLVNKNKDNKNENLSNVVYSVEIDNFLTDVETIEKENEFIITFSSLITPDEEISSVVINNQVYNVEKTDDGYQVVVKSPNKYGNQKFVITSVKLKNGKTVDVEDKELTIYVLKDKPVIKNIEVNNKGEVPVLNFDIEDKDNTFISGKVVMTQIKNISEIIFFGKNANLIGDILESTDVKVGHNSIEVPSLIDGMNYDLVISLDYSLDEKNTYTMEEKKQEKFEREYNFKLSSEKISSPVTSDSDLVLEFKNDAYSYKDFEKITIDGKTYNLVKDRETGIYTVVEPIDKCSSKGLCNIHITSVSVINDSLENKEIACDYYIEYLYLKDKPVINDIILEYVDEEATFDYAITDSDDTITSGTIIIEGFGKKVEIPLEKSDLTKGTFTKKLDLEKAGDYTVTLVVNYDLGDEKVVETRKVSADKIHQKIKADIKDVKVPSEKVVRGGKVELYLTITSNTEETVKFVTINDKDYSVELQQDGTYKVFSDVPLEGTDLTRTLKVTKLTYSEEVSVSKEVVVEVLKNKPQIKTFTLNSLGGQIIGEFTLDDEDKAVVGAKYTINGISRELNEEELKTLRFVDEEVRNAGSYNVQLTLIYDLGNGIKLTDVSDEQEVIVAVDANITGATPNSKFVTKGGEVVITYVVKDNTHSTLSTIKVNGNEYNVAHIKDDMYSVTIPVEEYENAGEKEFVATELKYVDGELFNLQGHSNTVSVTVLKDEPTIGELEVTYNKENKKVTGVIDVDDLDNSVIDGVVIVTGPCFDENKEFTITKEELLSGQFVREIDLSMMGEYTISLVVNYNLGDLDRKSNAKEDNLSIDLEIKDITIQSSNYVSKNGNVELVYKVVDNTDTKIAKVIVNGVEQNAVYDALNDTYSVILTAKDVYGFETFETSGLIYENNAETVDVKSFEKKVKVYVLKSIPEIKDITYTEKDATISVDDIDNAASSIDIKFTKVGNSEESQVFNVQDGKVDISQLSNGIYNVVVEVNYDLDEENDFVTVDKVVKEYENVVIVTFYNAEVNNLSLNNITEDKVTLEFDVTNYTDVNITDVKVEDKDKNTYTATLSEQDGKYLAVIDNPKTRVELTITQVTFETGKEIEIVPSNYILINKTKPEITVVTDVVNGKVNATITEVDSDNVIDKSRYYAVLKDIDNEIEIEKILIESEVINFTKVIDGDINYRVDVVADYDLVDGKSYVSDILKSSDNILEEASITPTKTYLPTAYTHPLLNDFAIKFEFDSNVKLKENIKTIKIKTEEYDGVGYEKVGIVADDGVDYKLVCGDSVRETEDGNYKTTCSISYKTPRLSSVIKVKSLSFNYRDKVIETTDSEEKLIDVTKWAPKINYKAINKYSEGKVLFEFEFEDIDMLEPIREDQDGKVYMTLGYGLINKEFKTDNLEANKKYTVLFENVPKTSSGIRFIAKIRYNQYHGIVDKENEKAQDITVVSFIHFFHPQDEITINDIQLVREDGNDFSNRITEGEQVRLAFKIDGDVDFKPTNVTISTDNKDCLGYKSYYTLTEDKNGYYVTNESLSGFIVGKHTLKINKLYQGSTMHEVTLNNTIDVEIVEPGEFINNLNNKTKLNLPIKNNDVLTKSSKVPDDLKNVNKSSVEENILEESQPVLLEEDKVLELDETLENNDEQAKETTKKETLTE